VVCSTAETGRCRSITLELPDWPGHRAGQHVDLRLTAEDGYQAERSYSIGSAPEDDRLTLTIERLDDGEVSPYLVDELRAEDELEVRGPIGGYFVWEESLGGPLALIAGGSGIVPLRSILRHHRLIGSEVPVRLLYSARSLNDVIYREELLAAEEVQLTLTRAQPDGWTGHRGRVDSRLVSEFVWPPSEAPLIYICGATGFVETVAEALVEAGHAPARVRTERFGPTGS
jgi:ferredoxin-NADP reductase